MSFVEDIVEVSHLFGGPQYCRAGGGNSSVKIDGVLYIKPSGSTLKDLTGEDLVPLNQSILMDCLHCDDPVDGDPVREAADKARIGKDDGRRPSVEILFHALLPQRFVLHLHPLTANALTCNDEAHELALSLFGDEAVVVDYANPGVPLARSIEKAREEHTQRTGKAPGGITFLRNHGIIVAADTKEDIISLVNDVTTRIAAAIEQSPDHVDDHVRDVPEGLVVSVAPLLRGLLGGHDGLGVVTSDDCDLVKRETALGKPIVSCGPVIPDQIVYAGALPCVVSCDDEPLDKAVRQAVESYITDHGHKPTIIVFPGCVAFAAGADLASAANALSIFTDALSIARDADRIGHCRVLNAEQVAFIEQWEAEDYRKSVAASHRHGRLFGKVAVVTGAAQGFGLGISQALAAQGAHVVLADLNVALATEQAAKLEEEYGQGRALAVEVNVSDEESQRRAMAKVVAMYGGLDLFVSNAGVARAASVTEQRIEDFDLVTSVNYKGYFLGVRTAAPIMAAQHAVRPDLLFDIVEINSKSGLEGSKRNFAYAGSKFGGIGLTQSFALELIESGIKVNAICPGNFLDGPLWSDPVRGLFVQYLEAGKVPGAKTVDDVRAYYESKVPMGRGCLPSDIVKAVLYLVDQQYETGQAIPVTGGQVMLS